MHKVNEYSDLASKKKTEALLLIAEDESQPEAYRMAAVWELEKRNETTEDPQSSVERLKQGWEANRERRYAPDKYHTFWPRFWAGIIDGFVITALLIVPMVFIVAVDSDFVLSWAGEIALDLLVYGYYVGMHAKYGQTLGKMAMNVKVVRHSDEGSIGLKAAFMRDLVPIALLGIALMANLLGISFVFQSYVDSISFFWLLAEIITMLTNEKRRAVHDFMAGTVVIRTR